jgi:hypothetical protein
MRPAAALLLSILATFAVGCGGSAPPAGSASATTSQPPSDSLEALLRAPGEDVAAVLGTSDYAPGENRVSFLVVDKESRLITTPTARVWVSRGLKQSPFVQTTANSEPIGVPGGATADAGDIYVANMRLAKPGKYWLLAEPVGAKAPIQAVGNIVVRPKSSAPFVGDRAISSDTPTLASTGGKLEQLTTSKRPDKALYRLSVADALAAKKPFVVTFATPLYCQSRTCGPVVDVVSAVRKQFAASGVPFIHVEIYKGNDPANGTNQWVDEWRLPTEPFTFVVDGKGIIRTRFEGAFSKAELAAAVRKVVS